MNTKLQAEKLSVRIYENRGDLGKAAAIAVAAVLRKMLSEQKEVNMIFAAAPSQNEFLAALRHMEDIPWNRVNAFHMDEYIGLPSDAPQGFGNFLRERLFDRLSFASVHYIRGNAEDPEAECHRYADLLKRYPTHITCMGIGENGHLAFNDPPVADFEDKALVKVVTLDEACRRQQVNDGCFSDMNKVPVNALTLTIPALMRSSAIFCMVPGKTKTGAVRDTLEQPVIEEYPSTILRKHEHATLFLDRESGALLKTTL
ncbi:glucosamine-6-phosphate deaminase [Sinomicrobium sp. M5D2P17]